MSGLNKTISENIVAYREENGEITSRAEIKKVPSWCQGLRTSCRFLRIPNAKNILMSTHPAVKALFKQLLSQILDDSVKAKLQALNLKETAEGLGLDSETQRYHC